jgi:uncharacterized protein YuzE
MTEVTYDDEADVLYFSNSDGVSDALQIGNLFVEFDSRNRIVGIEILDASSFLSDQLEEDVTEQDLNAVSGGDIRVDRNGELVAIRVSWVYGEPETERSYSFGVQSRPVTA